MNINLTLTLTFSFLPNFTRYSEPSSYTKKTSIQFLKLKPLLTTTENFITKKNPR